MTKPKILVTGATGKTGGAVVRQLVEKGWPVRAIVRTRDARSQKLDHLGAETVVADLYDPEQMTLAMTGTRRAYFCPPVQPYMIQSAVAFATAAQEAKLESVVGLSQWLANPEHPSIMTRQHWLVDRLFAMIPGVAHTVVNPGFFADEPYLSVIKYAANLGLYPLAVDGNSRNAPPSVEDIARVSVAAIIDPDRHAGKSYRPTGPKLISVRDVTQILGRVLGRKVRHVRVPMWMMMKAARFDGISPFLASQFSYYLQDLGRGAFEFGGPTDDVFAVTGQAPEDFETVARRHAARPEAQRSLGNRLRTFAEFMIVPFARGVRPKRFERDMGFPMSPNPVLSSDSERWKCEHGSHPLMNPMARVGGADSFTPSEVKAARLATGLSRSNVASASLNGGRYERTYAPNQSSPQAGEPHPATAGVPAHRRGEVGVPSSRRRSRSTTLCGIRSAATFALFGMLSAGLGFRAFDRAKTTIDPVNISSASTVVRAGIFRYTRNPMYLGMTLLLLGWAVYLSVQWALLGPLLFVQFITRYQIVPEERAMGAKFGRDYADFRGKVRRWL